MSRECVTHHHACDCREEKFRQLGKESDEKDKLIAELKEELAKERAIVNKIEDGETGYFELKIRARQRIKERKEL